MSRCPSRFELVRWDAGESPVSRKSEIEQHLLSCGRCAASLAEIRTHAQEYDRQYDRHLEVLRGRIRGETTMGASPNILPFRLTNSKKTITTISFVGVAMAAAAAFLLVLAPRVPSAPPFPAYDLESGSGNLDVRGDSAQAEVLTLVPGTKVELLARPIDRVEGEFEAKAFVLSEGRALPLEYPVRKDERGTVWLEGTLGQGLVLPRGTVSIWLVVFREGALPEQDEIARLAGRGFEMSGEGFVLLGKPVSVEP